MAIVLLIALANACAEKEPQDASAPDTSGSATTTIDWDQVPLGDMREVATPTAWRLLRSLDHWHGGQVPVIAVEVSADGLARDHTGNTVAMTPTQWKTMLEGFRRNPEQPVKLFAISNEAWQRYDDNWGHVAQFVYEIQTESENRLVLTVLGPYERPDR
jgi:hypothetical protein